MLRKASFFLILIFQVLSASCLLLVVYLIFALMDMNDADLMTGIGFLLFQPILALVLTAMTIIACFVIGLPIRLSARLNEWWKARPFIALGGVFIGIVLLILSMIFTEQKTIFIDGEAQVRQVPGAALSITGWFLSGFCLMHFYPQIFLKRALQRFRRKNQAPVLKS